MASYAVEEDRGNPGLRWLFVKPNGNGRVARLMSHAQLLELLELLDTGALCSVARGLARNAQEDKTLLANCDNNRRNDLDGRGTRSEEGLGTFTEFFLKVCIDQVVFMESLMQPHRLRPRILLWAAEEEGGDYFTLPRSQGRYSKGFMEKTFASARLADDVGSRTLITYLDQNESDLGIDSGILYYDFPLFKDSNEQLHRAGVLLASRSHGVALFSVVASDDKKAIKAADEDLTQLQSIIYGKCLQSKLLRRSQRELIFPVAGFLVAVGANATSPNLDNQTLTAFNQLPELLAAERPNRPLADEAWQELRSVLEGTKAIIRPRPRTVPETAKKNSKPAILAEVENQIANFDAHQRRAAISLVNGPQRIRGLAGSGKTVVLAMKAAHIHLNDPEAHILVTFYTKSLYDFIRRLITRFYRQFNDRDPDWSKVHVRHGWGGRAMGGVYYDACMANNQAPLALRTVAARANPFAYVCEQLLANEQLKQVYDYVLIDEAQDFPTPFFRLCFAIAKGKELDRNVIWAYDELQNIINVKVATPAETFGKNDKGIPLMDLDRAAKQSQEGTNHDIVLYKSYRNPREILICAHALGFGIYSGTMVQTLENKEHWEDLGYEVESGSFKVGSEVIN